MPDMAEAWMSWALWPLLEEDCLPRQTQSCIFTASLGGCQFTPRCEHCLAFELSSTRATFAIPDVPPGVGMLGRTRRLVVS